MRGSNATLYVSHGGGPLPLLGDPNHHELVISLQNVAAKIPKPSAIIVFSAHWESPKPMITSAVAPTLVYDYSGFPEESYHIQYLCPGQPQLAQQVYQILQEANIDADLDSQRGYDHGVFVPLKIMYPAADTPCIQISLVSNMSPLQHIQIGHALKRLPQQNLLVIGSGFSFHNLPAFFTAASADGRAKNLAFERWLKHTMTSRDISEKQRVELMVDWQAAPSARYCHPREEHLLPLHVCYGLTSRPCDEIVELVVMNKHASHFCWYAR